MEISDLPTLNASLNGVATVLLLAGYIMVRQRRYDAHRNFMLAAFATSVAFLISYLIYHYYAGSVRFTREGWIRPVYFFILITHIVLAATVPFLAVLTLTRAFQRRFTQHRRIARWTLPIWLYVSVTGVMIYLMLYQM
ncbi:MAG: DUF420 domain-containing protein [Acidobacteriota bacterium]